MRTFKRILSLILSCALLSSFIVAAHAANEPTIKVGSGELKKDEMVTVPVSIENISSVGAANIQIQYDSNNLTIDSISQMNGTAMGMFLMGTFVSNPAVGTVAWAGTATYPNPDNILFWITFSAKDSAVNGDYSISIEKIATASCLLGDGAAQVIDGVVSAPGTITITGGIDPATLIPTISSQPASANYTYGDTASVLSVTASDPEGAALTYQWYSKNSEDGEAAPIENATQATYTPALDAFGTTYYYCVVTNTYNGQTYTAASDAAAVTYSKGDISGLTVALAETEYVYDGAEKTPVVTVGTLTKDTDYTLSGTQSATNVGDYTITAAGTGNYEGTASATWKITPAEITTSTNPAMTIYTNGKDFKIGADILNVVTKGDQTPTIVYALKDGADVVSLSGTTLKALKAGTATITATITAPNHADKAVDIAVTAANKEDVSESIAFTAKDVQVVYDGAGHALSEFVNAATCTKGEVTYLLDGEVITSLSETTITDAGNYTITAVYETDTEYGSRSLTVSIAQKTIDVSAWKWDYNEAATYDAEQHSVELLTSNTDFDKVDITYTNEKATNAGDYTAIAALTAKDAANYILSDSSLTLDWTIKKATITVAANWIYSAPFTYDGTVKTVSVVGVPDTVTVNYQGNAEADAGTYKAAASFEAVDSVNYTVSGAVDDLEWTINKAEVNIPTAAAELKYNGEEQIGVSSVNTDIYTVTGGTATDVGSYTATASLKDSDNYKWTGLTGANESADQDIHWSIAKADALELTDSVSLRYSNTAVRTVTAASLHPTAGDIEITDVSTDDDTGILSDAALDANGRSVTFALVDGLEAEDAGKTAKINITFSSKNYEDSTLTLTVTVIDKEDVSGEIIFEEGSAFYTGDEHTYEEASVSNSELTGAITYSYSSAEVKNVGTYSVTAIYEDADNYGTKTVTFTIRPAILMISGGTVAEKTYDGGTDATVTDVTFSGLVKNEELSKSDYTVSNAAFDDANAGTNKTVNFTVALNSTDVTKNYELTSDTGSAEGIITAKPITVTLGGIDDQTYTGSELKPAVTVSATGTIGGYELIQDTDYTVSYTGNTAAGTAAVTVSSKTGSNYTFDSVETSFTIDKADPDVTADDLTVPYTGEAIPADQISGTAQFNGLDISGVWSWVTEPAGTSAGETPYDASVKFIPDNTNLNESAVLPITVTIEKATPTGTPSFEKINTSGKTLADVNLAIGTITPDGGTLKWVDSDGSELPDDTKVAANKAYTWVYTPVDLDNYNELTGTITPYVYIPYVPVPTSYAITVSDFENGTVSLSASSATSGTTVTITAAPDEGYEAAAIEVRDNDGNLVPVTDNGDGTYSFEMPKTAVTVEASFVEVAESTDEPQYSFVDVPAGAWFTDAVNVVVERGLFTGTSATTFDPNLNMTRAMLVTVLWRLDGSVDASSTGKFSDVLPGQWYTTAVDWASGQGVVLGMSDSLFGVDVSITREQLVTILYRYAQAKGYDTSARADLSGYVDADAVSSYAQEAVSWAVAAGLITGTTDNTLDPVGNATRAQVAMILMRYMEIFVA